MSIFLFYLAGKKYAGLTLPKYIIQEKISIALIETLILLLFYSTF